MTSFPVPVDYSDELTYLKTTCAACGEQVTYANTIIVDVPIIRAEGDLVYPGMTTHISKRVCWHH